MLKKKWMTARGLFREGGIRGVYEYSWRRLQVLAKGHKNEIRIDRCTISLRGVADSATRIELIIGTYEAAERQAVNRYLRRAVPVVELGGSMGVVACVTNKLLQDRTAHVVVEANPLAIPYLERNRQLNRCQFEVVNRAIAYGVDTITFRPATGMAGSSITRAGDQAPVTVPATQLGELVKAHGFDRFTLVCDIEGLEYDLICQEAEVLKNADTLIMETHARFIGEDKLRMMMNKLEELGFRLVEQIGFVVVLQNTA
jgi:FkbM family methyltransferase